MRLSIDRRIFDNPRFRKMFLRYILWVFLGITIPLLVSEFAVYSFSNIRLTEKVDEANERGLITIQAICDNIIAETESIALRFDLSMDVESLLRMEREKLPEYRFFSLANGIMEDMTLSRRTNLDENISIYSADNNFILCTARGGQQLNYYEDEDLVPLYQKYIEKDPGKSNFYVLRKIFFNVPTGTLSKKPIWVLTYYRTLTAPTISNNSFIAININANKLSTYLQKHPDSATIFIIDENNKILLDTVEKWTGQNIENYFQQSKQIERFKENKSGAMNIQAGETMQRMNWVTSSVYGWRFVQIIPYAEYLSNSNLLERFVIVTVAMGLVVSIVIAFLISIRLFHPIADIMHIMENPHAYDQINDQSGEVKYLLMNILQSLQKNVTLEKEMVKKVADLRSARAKALQEQMTPHFLYNTLQAINWLAISETNLEASKTTEAIITLSEIIRTCMEQSDNMTTIEKELEHVKKFVSLEQLRFGDTIQYHYDIQSSVLEKKIPRISIQPLVENAITHGIKPAQLEGMVAIGHIYICIKKQTESIIICVEDNGIGMHQDEIQRFNKIYQEEYVYANQHVGLLNLSQRIKLIYGDKWKIVLSSSRFGGLKVEIAIPFV